MEPLRMRERQVHMKALNRAFEKAFLHSEGNDNIEELIACMGEELGCVRVSIFEENDEGTCDNTYEWCKAGVIREQILLQHVDLANFDTWHERLTHNETIVVHNREELQEHDPDVYRMFTEQDIHTAIVTLLAFHGKNFGFCILEDPSGAVMTDAELIIPGVRYILSSMLYSRNLVHRLRRLGYTDALTGVGNRVSLQEHLENIDHGESLAIMCLDVIGWDNDEGKVLHLEKEQTLLRAGEILSNLLDEDHVFRVATGEFIVVESGVDKATYTTHMRTIRGLFHEHNLLCAMAGEWAQAAPANVDDFIHGVHEHVEEERRVILTHRKKASRATTTEDDANITIPKGEAFFRLADRFLANLFEESVVTVAVDINYFKLYNDIYGRAAGNVFLENIARLIDEAAQKHHGICGYIGGDDFCLMVPTLEKENAEIAPLLQTLYDTLDFPDGFAPSMGAYLSKDQRETVTRMYDRAQRALADIKGDYIRHINFYSADAHKHQREDKLLLSHVKEGLARDEFVFFIQPQVHERSGKIIGGEALVRWRHDGQLVPPSQFVPVLEKTGHIYAVDSYIWESVAKWQRGLLDKGVQPVPISVNVSRIDFYFEDIAEKFIGLIKKYGLDPDLIGVEITESAFTDNIDTITEAIQRLHEAGLHVLMDDFGSGSSSLAMLHTMNLDVLKTDVQFMSKDNSDNRAISIVESVISMAHLIGMSVVTEGVETEAQKENLIALGDNYAQGYYFFKPMPADEFEALIADPSNVTRSVSLKVASAANQLRFREMIRKGLVSEALLDNILRAAAIYKVQNGKITLLQLNDAYAQKTGIDSSDAAREHFEERLVDKGELFELLQQANTHSLNGSEGIVRFEKPDESTAELRMRVFLLYALDDHKIYLSTMA